jgi:ribonucleoside-diphosphate reductase alpha chain
MTDSSQPRDVPWRSVPRVSAGTTTRFTVGDQKGYLTTSTAEDGGVGEVAVRMAKQGSTLAGMMDAFGIALSQGLRAGAPLEVYVSKFSNMRFTPDGRTDDEELPVATSLIDYMARRLAVDHLPPERRAELGILTAQERAAQDSGEDSWIDLDGLSMSASREP